MARFDRRHALILLLALVYSLVVWRALTLPAGADVKARGSLHGDSYSDLNTLSAIRHYYDQGFAASCGLPVHQYDGPQTPAEQRKVYLHYPALPDMIGGGLAVLLGTPREAPLRLATALLSLLFAGLLWLLARRVAPDPAWAAAILALWLASNYFIFWADSLHKHQYEEAAKAAFLLLAWRYYEGSRSWGLLAACAAVYVLAANVSFEPIVYLAVVSVGWSWVYEGRIISRFTVAMGLAAVAGFGLHLLQNWCWLGGWEAVWQDTRGAFMLRTVGEAHGEQTSELARGLTFIDYMSLPLSWFNRVERTYLVPGWALVALTLLCGRQLWRERRRDALLLLTLFLASIAWSLAMTQHYKVHAFTARHFALWAGLTVAWLGPLYVRRLRDDWASGNILRRTGHALLLHYVAGMALSQHVLDWFRYGWLHGS